LVLEIGQTCGAFKFKTNDGAIEGTDSFDFETDNRNRSSFIGFIPSKTVSAYDTFVSKLDTAVPDMHSRVRDFLFGEKVTVEEVMKWTHAELFRRNLLAKRSEDLEDTVKGTDIRWPVFEFTALKGETMVKLIAEKTSQRSPHGTHIAKKRIQLIQCVVKAKACSSLRSTR
jgi:hypothetical protein